MIQRFSRGLAAVLALGLAACGGSGAGDTTTPDDVNNQTNQGTEPVGPQGPAEAPPVEAKGHPSADLIPRELFYGNPERAGVQISPDGKQLSWLAPKNDVLNVFVAPRGKLEEAKAVTDDQTRPVRRYFWAYTNQHIIYLQDTGGDENWHVFSVNLKTGKTTDLTPKKGVQARIEAVSHKSPKEIVVGVNDRNPQLHDLYKVNIETGEMKLLQENPGFVGFSVDDDYKVRLAMTMTPDGGMVIMEPDSKKAKKAKKAPAKDEAKNPFAGWKEFITIGQADTLTTGPIAFDRRGRNLYMWDSRDRNTGALTRVDLRTGKTKVLAEHPKADGSGIHIHPTTKEVLAVAFTHARQQWKFLDKKIAADYAKLKEISDGEANVVDTTKDHDTWVVAYEQDDGPVSYYLYDRKKKKAEHLFVNRPELAKVKLSQMHPVIIKSRDGLELVSYLSLPRESDPDADGKPTEPQPMVLLVHGGPWARDEWGYDPVHQTMADRGYAALSVNYRGSTGFGKEFINAGNMEWAGKMHEDLVDAVNWAVEQGIAQKDKICIMGGSYGGYATLVGLTFTPDLFACGVDIVGPSSILTLLEAIPPYWKPMQNIFKTRVGDWTTEEGKKFLMERSPLSHVDKIKKPLLIGQGANDPRVKQAESDQIVQAMKAKKIPVSYIVFPDEGHGFAREENRLAFFAAAEAFLSAHLGGKYQPATAEELKGSSIKVPAGLHGIPGFTSVVNELQTAK